MSYNNTNPLYGGGGSTGPNYYDPTADFSPAVSAAKYQRRTEKNPSYNNPYNNNEEDDDSDPEDTSFFARAIGFISEHKDRLKGEEIDEGKAVDAHQTLYGSGNTSSEKTHDAEFLGSGAAMQALKMFLESKNEKDSNGKAAGDGGQNRLIGIAMAQAGKLWERDNKAGKAATDKQSAVNAAAKYALQMYLKGNSGGTSGTGGLGGLAGKLLSGSGGGGSGSGSGADLLGLAKKFL